MQYVVRLLAAMLASLSFGWIAGMVYTSLKGNPPILLAPERFVALEWGALVFASVLSLWLIEWSGAVCHDDELL